MYDAYERDLHALRAHVPVGEGAVGRDRRRHQPGVHGRRRGGRGRLRLVRELRLRREHRGRDAAGAPAKAAPGDDVPALEKRAHARHCPASTASPSTSVTNPSELLKASSFDVDGELGLAVVPGDREVNEFALAARAARPRPCGSSTDDDFAAHPELPKGYIGPDFAGAKLVRRRPVGAARRTRGSPARTRSTTTCATLVLGRDFTPTQWAEIVDRRARRPVPEAAASRCASTAASRSATCSSSARSTPRRSTRRYTDEDGEQHPMVMGCYGIGVSRIVAAVVEEHHDDDGHRVAGGARAVRRAPRSCCRARATPPRRCSRPPSSSTPSSSPPASTCSTTTARREPGREVRRRRPARHAGAAHVGAKGIGARRSSSARSARPGRDEIPLAEVGRDPRGTQR